MSDTKNAATLLLVDDDAVNRIAFTRAFKKLKVNYDLVSVEDGIEALDYLNSQVARHAGALPSVIVFLDIYMPRMNGLEFCAAVSSNCCLDGVVVYAFATADTPDAIRVSLDPRVAGYLTKNNPLETLQSTLCANGMPTIQ